VAGSCEHGNEPSGSIKCWEILGQLSNQWLLKKDSVPGGQLVLQQQYIQNLKELAA
jgi:hypothetical protein